MKRIFTIIVLTCLCSVAYTQNEVACPTGLKVTEIDEYSATLTWNKQDGIMKYIVSYDVAMSENAITKETTDTFLYIDDLLSATQYLWKIRAVSADWDTSDWSNIGYFYTLGYSTNCNQVSHITISPAGNSKLLVGWTAEENALYWEIVYDEIGSNPDDIGKRYFTSDWEYTLENLQIGTSYQIAIRSHCQGAFSNWSYAYIKYSFEQIPLPLPIKIDFSDDNSTSNIGLISSNTNPWIIGCIENSDLQEKNNKYLYISNDNGENAIFNNNIKTSSYAFIDFYVPEFSTGFCLSFDYMSNLISNNDGLKVFLTSDATALDIESMISSSYQVGKTIYNNTNGEWQEEKIVFSNTYADSPRKIVFAWTNTDTCQDNSSIILKNISITPHYCPTPDSLLIDAITYNGAEVSWNLKDFWQTFNLQYRKLNDTTWNTIEEIYNHYILDILEENTTYEVRLQANCTNEQSLFSPIFKFTTEIFIEPIDATSIKYDVSYNSVHLNWTEKDNVKFYCVDYKENIPSAKWKTIETATNACTISDLYPNTQYACRIRIVNMQDKTSKYSDEINFTTLCTPIFDFPYIVHDEISYSTLNGFTSLPTCYDTSLSALMTPVLDLSSLEVAVLSFDILANNSVNIFISNDNGKTYSSLANIKQEDLLENTYVNKKYILSEYKMEDQVQIKFVFNSNGKQNVVAKLKNITVATTCTAPRSIYIDSISYSFFTVWWSENNMATSWIAKLYNDKNELLKTLNVGENSCTFTGLDENTLYKVVVKSYCSITESYDSVYLNITTLNSDDGGCHAPKNFKAYWFKTKGEETILANWEASNNDKVWEVWYKDVYAMDWNRRTVTVVPSFSIRNLDRGVSYEIKVRTICSQIDTSDFTHTDTVTIDKSSLMEIWDNVLHTNAYPNPAKDFVNIECPYSDLDKLELRNFDGKVITTLPYEYIYSQRPIYHVDLSNIGCGVFILYGYVDNKIFAIKIIKN